MTIVIQFDPIFMLTLFTESFWTVIDSLYIIVV